jgi:Putative metallopeptidase
MRSGSQEGDVERADPADVHDLDAQRFYNLPCIAYGAEARLFADLVEKKYLPESRAEDCADEYGQVAYAVKTLMSCYVDESAREKVFAEDWVRGKFRRKTAGDTRSP